jgi:chromosome segregation ATPase
MLQLYFLEAISVLRTMDTAFGSAEAILGHLAKVKLDYEQLCAQVTAAQERQQVVRNETLWMVERMREIRAEIQAVRENRIAVESEKEDEEICVQQLENRLLEAQKRLKSEQNQREELFNLEAQASQELERFNEELFEYAINHKYRDDIANLDKEISETEIHIAQANAKMKVIKEKQQSLETAEFELQRVRCEARFFLPRRSFLSDEHFLIPDGVRSISAGS